MLADALLAAGWVHRDEAAKIAEGATLPEHFIWGNDAMEQFNFGKERAALAVTEEKKAEPYVPSPEAQATFAAIDKSRRDAAAAASTTFIGGSVTEDAFTAPDGAGKIITEGE